MQHLDDGALAAYLDGEPDGSVTQHLATCEECQERLDAMRVTRERAKAILRLGTPSGAQPSFQDILKRRQKVVDGGRLARLRPLAWAASILLALSVGWYAREMQLRPSAQPMSDVTVSLSEADRAAAASPTQVASAIESTPAQPRAFTRARPILRAPREETAARRDGGAAGIAGAVGQVVADREKDQLANVKRADDPAEPPAAVALAAATVDSLTVRPPDRLADAANENQLKKLAAGEPARPTELKAEQAAAGQRRSAPVVPPGPTRQPAQRLIGVDLARATQVLGRAPAQVPGLQVMGYVVQGSAVTVIQRLPGGGVVEFIEQPVRAFDAAAKARVAAPPPAPSPSAAPESRAARAAPAVADEAVIAKETDARTVVGGLEITARGTISNDSLRVLVGKLR